MSAGERRRATRPVRRVVDGVRPALSPAADERLIWLLGLGALGLAWPTATVAAYLPPVLHRFTDSDAVIGAVLASEGLFAIFVPLAIGPLSDATRTPLGRRRPYMALALLPLAVPVALLGSLDSLAVTTLLLFVFYFGNYVYEPPWRGLYADLLPLEVAGRGQASSHVMRGIAMAGALVGGGLALDAWQPAPFLVAAVVAGLACGVVVAAVREADDHRGAGRRVHDGRKHLAAPWRLVRRDANVRAFLLANAAWETAFAGMRTFVVLAIVDGFGQSLAVSSAVLAVVTVGYAIAAVALGPFADRIGVGRVILVASTIYGLGLFGAGFATRWHDWYYAVVLVVAVAAGAVMTLAWALLFKVMPERDQGAATGLALATRGIGLLVGPPLVGLSIDWLEPLFEQTDGYGVVWPAVSLPVLAAVPLVARLARVERERTAAAAREHPPTA
ncbi:MAG: MFS transporter [Thermoleophilia bacterium]